MVNDFTGGLTTENAKFSGLCAFRFPSSRWRQGPGITGRRDGSLP